jgi:hypothetical protein
MKICSAISKQQAASQRVEKPSPAAPTEAPSRHEMLFGPAVPRWEYVNQKAEIAVKPRSRVLWHR